MIIAPPRLHLRGAPDAKPHSGCGEMFSARLSASTVTYAMAPLPLRLAYAYLTRLRRRPRLGQPASTHVHGRPSGVHECIASGVWKCIEKPASTHVHGRPSGVHECIASDVWKSARMQVLRL